MKRLITICVVTLMFGVGSAMAGTWTTLDYPGATWTEICGIDGSNIVGYYEDASGYGHGFLYNGTGWTTLDYPGATWTCIRDIDGNNLVGPHYDASGYGHGFLYNGTGWTNLDMPGANLITEIYGIDGSNLVGSYYASGYHGFLYNGTGWTTLDYPGATWTWMYGIDGSNIVGYYGDAPGYSHGFLYNGTGWTTLDYPGSTWTQIYGIDGSNLVGTYRDASGAYHGFIYTIPEPAIEATVDIDPNTLNLQSKGKWITCYLSLPADYNVVDINSASIVLEETIKAAWTWVDDESQIIMAKFSRSEVQAILQPGQVELKVRGEFINGRKFEGKDTIIVINEGKP